MLAVRTHLTRNVFLPPATNQICLTLLFTPSFLSLHRLSDRRPRPGPLNVLCALPSSDVLRLLRPSASPAPHLQHGPRNTLAPRRRNPHRRVHLGRRNDVWAGLGRKMPRSGGGRENLGAGCERRQERRLGSEAMLKVFVLSLHHRCPRPSEAREFSPAYYRDRSFEVTVGRWRPTFTSARSLRCELRASKATCALQMGGLISHRNPNHLRKLGL